MPSPKHSSNGKLLLALQSSNSAASVIPASGSRKSVPLKRRGEKNSSGGSGQGTNSSTSALEQLNFERGVCNPYRKYTPETQNKQSLIDVVVHAVNEDYVEMQMISLGLVFLQVEQMSLPLFLL